MLAALTDRQWLWLAAACYLAGFLRGARSVFRGERPSSAVMYGFVAAGYALQYLGLYLRGRAEGDCPLGNIFEIVQFIAWSAITPVPSGSLSHAVNMASVCSVIIGA